MIAHLYASYAADKPGASSRLGMMLATKAPALARRQANAAAALTAMGQWENALALLRHSPDPTVRSYLIERLGSILEAPGLLLERDRRLEVETRQGLLFERDRRLEDVGTRQGALMAWGDLDQDSVSVGDRELLIPGLEKEYRDHPDAGIHGAAGWLLREWGQQGRLAEIDRGLRARLPAEGRHWYVNGQGQTMVLLPLGEFRKGEGEKQERRRIDHGFALATREVTVAEFLHFRAKHDYDKPAAPTVDCPVNKVSWYEAAEYCNWLSKEEGVPKEQWCYLPNDKGEYAEGMKVPADYLRRTGYRLPTEDEWEYACRAGSATTWSMGGAEDLLVRYGWHTANSLGHSHPAGSLRPNDWGLFDMHGNVWEWCHDNAEDNKVLKDKEEVISKVKRWACGGSFADDRLNACSSSRISGLRGDVRIGFRPARTVR
jgi:formylglycine-generating enzyme required for sulfatase activity